MSKKFIEFDHCAYLKTDIKRILKFQDEDNRRNWVVSIEFATQTPWSNKTEFFKTKVQMITRFNEIMKLLEE